MKKVVSYFYQSLFKIKQANRLFGKKQSQEKYTTTEEVVFV